MSRGVHYTNAIISILSLKIFHGLIGLNLYDEAGERRRNTVEISEEIREVVQYPSHYSYYLAHSTAHIEFYKSKCVEKNVILGPRVIPKACVLCERIFRSGVN